MAPDSNDMSDLDQPVTRRELRTELQELRSELAGKAALEAAKIELRQHIDVTMTSFRDELRTHFDIIAESLRADIHNMFDWMKANINGVTSRVDALETGHGTRLTALETRVTKLEANRNQ
jgi:hypothetical protein